MNSRLFFWSLTSALAGFLFGFDTVVISGAEKTIQELWGLGDFQHGLAMSAALWGTVVGSLIGGWPTDRFGRSRTLLCIGVLYFASAIWSALATDVYSFMVARLIGGLGVGISTIAAPLYISEISPPASRGRLTGMFQFNIVFGILIAFLSNYMVGKLIDQNAWRWMLGVEAVPALVYTVLCLTLPKSPRWLLAQKGDRTNAEKVLRLIQPNASTSEITATADEMQASASLGADESREPFWTSRLRTPILLALLVAFFNQMSGINAILYFAPRIFQLAGVGENAALLNSIGIGITNLVFTFIGLWLIDRLGRRTLLFIGSAGYVASLGLCAFIFLQHASEFKVANTAMTLQSTILKLQSVNERAPVVTEDVNRLRNQLSIAKSDFVAAASASDYAGEAVTVAGNVPLDKLLQITTTSLDEAAKLSGSGGTWVMLCIFAFIAAHAIGQGAVIWVLISEIFPARHRASGQALGSFTHWIFAALLTWLFPIMIGTFEPRYVFLFFCTMMVLQGIWVAAMVPETKGVPLEDMEAVLGIKA